MLGLRRLCVFCGSSRGARADYRDAARAVGRLLGSRGIGLVYGGGNVGLMGELADAALAAKGEVIGVIPRALERWEVAHQGLTRLEVVDSMHQRKARMAELADGFLALPGGFGTLEELCEVLTWAQLEIHRRPCALLNVAGYFDPLLKLLDHAVAERFLWPEHRELLIAAVDPVEVLDRLERYVPPRIPKWVDRDGLLP